MTEREKINVPDVPAPTAVLCWKQSRLMVRCDRRAGHGGLHSWEHAEGGADALAPAPQKAEALHPRAVQIAQWLVATGWIGPEEENDIALDLTLSFPPCARNELLPQARLLELCAEFGITDADALKHRLEDWTRWRADALAPPEPGWQPIATCPRDVEVIFWLVPKTAEESYTDTSGHPIVSTHAGYWKRGGWLSWGALSKPTHWQPLPAPPRADALDAPPHEHGHEETEDHRYARRNPVTLRPTGSTASQPEVVRALTDTARRAVDALRDVARAHGMHHIQRDPLVMDIHRALDAFDALAALDAAPSARCPATTPGSQIHDPARCALPVGHAGDHQVAPTPGPSST